MFHLLASRTDFDTQTWAAANSCAHPVFILLLLLLLWGTGCWAKRLSRGHRGPAEEGETYEDGISTDAWCGGDV